MKSLAIDVVLLLPGEAVTEVLVMNRALTGGGGKITLNRDATLPHISLCMGSVRASDLGEIYHGLGRVLAGHDPLKLTSTGIYTSRFAQAETVSSLEIARTPELEILHQDICTALTDWILPSTRADELCRSEKVDAATLEYVKEFVRRHAGRYFRPHVTLGIGQYETRAPKLNFDASIVAVCHLGPYCTCEKVLHTFELSG